MFYSQFILAKKGPLGTIWIAAHLERKLKKNQVADTDIGVSVDSILFPEVPIALRLSSHLLLGVVRIYSRKVNYLFHDCSEALLKVKQAFRSTAVDLPPEESTAPYHSITLPETFDLDDFELPDSALLSGNFDDRHVSTREQITLQDTLDGTGYSTSQFGLDERFGDGDASQIGLDLDEELLLDNNLSLRDASVLDGAVHQGEGLTKMDIDKGQHGHDEDQNDDASKELSDLLSNNRGKHVVSNVENVNRHADSSHRLIFNIQTPDLNEVFLPDDHIGGPSAPHDIEMDFAAADPTSPEFNESANFPSTPGLFLKEAIQANSHELPASSIPKNSPCTAVEAIELDKPINQEVECTDAINAASTSPKPANLAQVVSSPTSVLAEPKPVSVEAGPDAANNCNLTPVGPTDPKLSDNSQVLPLSTSAPQCFGGTMTTPGTCGEANAQSDNSQVLPSSTSAPQCFGGTLTTPVTCGEVNAQSVSLDNSLISGMDRMVSGIDGITLADTARLSNLDQGRTEVAHSCQTSNITTLSDFHLRSCTTAGNQTNLISPEDMVQERAEGFSFREQPCNLETPMVDQEFNFSGSSADLQGFRSAIVTDANLVGDQKPNHVQEGHRNWFSFREQPFNLETPMVDQEFNFIGSSADLQGFHLAIATDANLVGDQKSNHVQAGHGNCFSSSEFSEPERMRFAPSGNVNLLKDLGKQTTEKGVIESDGSVDRISTLSGHKRHLIDITPDLQNGISPRMSGIPRKKQNNDYIPNDDDLLASILVGRRTPVLRVGPTPPHPKPPLIKRPRLTNKLGLPKRRKVLLDDKIVLHADAIRQQLINTEDIRRIRKKVPCTRSEIWRIQKSSLEDDIFCESIFTGISGELNSLLTRRYDLAQNVHSQINGQHSSGEASKGLELSKSSILVGENDGKEMDEQSPVVPKRIDGEMQGPSGILELIEAESTDALERLEPSHDPCHVDLPGNTISSDLDADICANPDQNSLNNSHELAEANNSIVHVAAKNETSLQGKDFSNAKDVSITVEDMGVDIVNVANLDCPRDGLANIGKDENGGTAVSVLDRFIVEVGADFPVDSSTVIGYANSSVPDMSLVDGGPVSSEKQTMKDSEEGRVTAGYESVVDEERPDSEFPCGERPHSTESERVPSAVGENSCMNIECGLDVESTPMELAATKEPSDFCSDIDDIDTDFLNVDDEVEYDDETNDDVPNTEEAQSLENSGWSSRTRGVARYLKNMFDQESGRGRKSVAIDQLLTGKTRKEASRMFFETLVLKTKDYIHVEQENPFDFVNIKPRIKLLKSEF